MTDPLHHTELTMKLSGMIDLGEYKESEIAAHDFSAVLRFLDDFESDNVELEIGYSDDLDHRETIGFFIALIAYHQKNPKTDRSFNTRLVVRPSRDEMAKLRDYLDFLLKFHAEDQT